MEFVVISLLGSATPTQAVTPQSPEVKELVKKGLNYLNKAQSDKLGGKCLIGLAYLKTDPPQPNHPKIKEALQACQAGTKKRGLHDMYSNGLAVIFLCELGPRRHDDLVRFYLGALKRRQKDHGGWGYEERKTGDTSQTQYAALSYWEAHHNGYSIESTSVERLTEWLIRTQDPEGAWGYQGRVAPKGKKVEQEAITCSMLAAAMGSMLIASDLFGLLDEGPTGAADKPMNRALKRKGEQRRKEAPKLRSNSLNRKGIFAAIKNGAAWMEENYTENIGKYNIYYLYSLERYKSFEEVFTGNQVDEPEWYNNGYKFLKSTQREDGSWNAGCTAGPDTAFAILFLIRSTQKMLDNSKGDTMVGGMGLPDFTRGVKVENGQVVVEKARADFESLMEMFDQETDDRLNALAKDPTALIINGEIDEAGEQRLRQVVRGGSPAARLLAVRTLGRTGKLDHVPTLIYALTDPDRQVTLQARDSL
ncbi:MAG: prenyltransferase/squalene oxidase repeat-containing protein, partial [Planctomycetota bacterium]